MAKTENVKYADLQIGDIVDLGGETFSTAVVENVTETEVTFARPMIVIGDFITTAGVSTSTHVEKFKVSRSHSTGTVTLLRREDPEHYRKLAHQAVRKAAQAIEDGDKHEALRALASYWGWSAVNGDKR